MSLPAVVNTNGSGGDSSLACSGAVHLRQCPHYVEREFGQSYGVELCTLFERPHPQVHLIYLRHKVECAVVGREREASFVASKVWYAVQYVASACASVCNA
jgi:hypothetical protein